MRIDTYIHIPPRRKSSQELTGRSKSNDMVNKCRVKPRVLGEKNDAVDCMRGKFILP
jgi:hypothetical protein